MDIRNLLHIGINHGYIIQILLAEAIYTLTLKRRGRFALRAAAGVPAYAVSAVVLTNIAAWYTPGLTSAITFSLSLALCVWCFQAPLEEILFCCVAAQLTQNLSYNVENLIYRPFAHAIPRLGWLVLSVVVMVLVYTACYFILARRLELQKRANVNGAYIYTLSIATTLFVFAMQYLFQKYRIDELWITRPPLILCCIFGLCVQFGLLALTNEQEDKKMLERLIENEHRQQELREQSIDLINRKAHDLKHQISRFRAAEWDDEDELAEIESALEQYETGFDTGSRTLDAILSEKQLQCQREQIQLSAMVQGEALSFLRPGEVASLFGNALDNAIECEQSIPEPTKRCIALNVFEQKNLVCIRVENYCPMERTMVQGLPVTTKGDRNYHGFGMKSIQYIVQKYDGTLHISTDNDLFVLSALLPVPKIVEDA